MNALVTGATGFIGSHLVERLVLRGARVRCVVRRSSDPARIALLRSLRAGLVETDCRDNSLPPGLFDGITHVFHLAGMTRARRTEDYFEGNCAATERLAEACVGSGVRIKRFVLVSSLAAVGPSLDGRPVDEESPPHPVSAYGRSKLAAEQVLRRLTDRLPWAIVRPSAVYGPRDRDLFDYFRMIAYGIFPAAGSFDSKVNLVSWSDVVDAILLAAEHPAAVGNTFHIGDSRNYSTGEVGDTIASVMGRHPIRIRLPQSLVRGVAALTESCGRLIRKPVFLTKEKANELLQLAWTCSIAHAHLAIGYQPHIALADGLAMTYRWYRKEGLLN